MGLYVNGLNLNGMYSNGQYINGLNLNGLMLNGINMNGLNLNGLNLNGLSITTTAPTSSVGTVTTVSTPPPTLPNTPDTPATPASTTTPVVVLPPGTTVQNGVPVLQVAGTVLATQAVAGLRLERKYKLMSTGAGTITIPAAGGHSPDMLTDGFNGALRDYLAVPVASQDEARSRVFERDDLTVFVVQRSNTAQWALDADVVGGRLAITATCTGPDLLGSYLVVQYRHSMIR
jgi:hypothetical protein